MQQHAPTQTPVSAVEDRPPAGRVNVGSAAFAVTAAVVVAASALWAYGAGWFGAPLGYDTPLYIWRAELVARSGLAGLVGWAPEYLNVHGDRTGLLVFMSWLMGATGWSGWQVMYVIPAIVCVSVGLAVGAFARAVLGEPWWAFGIYVVAAGASTNVARLVVGSHDNAFVMSMLVAAAVTALMAAAGCETRTASVALLVAAALSHWRFTALYLVLLLLLALVLLPHSWKRGPGVALLQTPSGRLATIIGWGALLAVAAMGMTPMSPLAALDAAPVPDDRLQRKVARRLPSLRLDVLGPLAIIGAAASWRPRSDLRRWGVIFLVMWSLTIVISAFVDGVFDMSIPLYRVAAFALCVPILATAAVVAALKVMAGWRPVVGPVIATLVVAIGLGLMTLAGRAVLRDQGILLTPDRVAAMADVSAYLDEAKVDGPIVIVSSIRSPAQSFRVVYAGVPPRLITQTQVHMGSYGNLVAGVPTVRPAYLAEPSAMTLDRATAALRDGAVVIYIAALNPADQPPRGSVWVADGVYVLHGPALRANGAATGSSWSSLVAGTAAGLGLVLVVGTGWTWSFVPAPWLVRLGLAPSIGAAMIASVGTATDRLGLTADGATLWMLVFALSSAGWIPAIAHSVRRRRANALSP